MSAEQARTLSVHSLLQAASGFKQKKKIDWHVLSTNSWMEKSIFVGYNRGLFEKTVCQKQNL